MKNTVNTRDYWDYFFTIKEAALYRAAPKQQKFYSIL